MIGRSLAIRRAIRLIEQAAPTDVSVVITGESGTGKERAARAIHDQSPRCNRQFVPVNCSAFPEGLIESELFGHERGAFTSADRRQEGLFERASGGTIFLDEVTEMPLTMQPKLLRVVEEQRIRRLGGSAELPIDVRIVAASNRSIPQAVRDGQFREDLFYRLSVLSIVLPPLRDRIDDVPPLVDHFIEHFNRKMNRNVQGAEQDFLDALMAHWWPGNIRELRNVIERAIVVCDSPKLSVRDLPAEIAGRYGPETSFTVRLGSSGSEVERELLFRTVGYVGGNKARAADILGMSRGTLYNRLKRYGLPETNGHVNGPSYRNGRNRLS
ncbi:MAG: sigma-54-dependent Fis family transcriptional regulator [Candidatus Binataceae bacterium]|nr:sigma-54-dependent Fis family transcriptional regulator [Candidatus Binataceae bacterium]